MSQYEFKFDDTNLTVRFGWDPPLETYYFQIKDNAIEALDADGDPMIFWVGTKPQQIYEVEDLVKIAPQQYKSLVQRHEVQLFADKDDGR
jgi:hypothetical protein